MIIREEEIEPIFDLHAHVRTYLPLIIFTRYRLK